MDPWIREALSNAGWATALALVATVAGLLVRRRPALIHTLWLLVLLKLATPSLVHRPLEAEAVPAEVAPIAAVARAEAPEAVELPGPPLVTEARPPEPPIDEPDPLPPVDRRWPWNEIAVAAWLGGAVAWWSAVAWQVVRSRKLIRAARPAPGPLVERTERLARRIGLRRGPAVGLVHARIPPLLWAIVGPPRLLLPEGLWARLDEGQQDAVLVHELAHLKRRDHWVRWLEAAVLGLYWWNPVAWWARRRVEEAEEECCDAWVRWALPRSVQSYAEALVETAVFLSGPRPPWSPATTGVGPITPLRRRLMMILDDPASRRTYRPGPRAALILGILCLPFLPAPAPAEPARQVPEAQPAPAPAPARPGEVPSAVAPAPAQDRPSLERLEQVSDRGATQGGSATKRGDSDADPRLRVAHPIVREVNDYEDFNGRVEAAQTVEIRSRVGGILVKVEHRDGQVVEKGDVLYEIDPGIAQAEFDKADAETSRCQARMVRCTADKRRADAMLARNAIGREDFDRIEGDFAEAEASSRGARATRELAKLKLDSTKVRAPIRGRVSRPRLTEGGLVMAETTVLATLDSEGPIRVAFDIDERTALKLGRIKPTDQVKTGRGVGLAVFIGLADEEGFPHSGRVAAMDTRVDPASRMVQCRAIVLNPDGFLLPGMFARVRLILDPPIKVLLVADSAAPVSQGFLGLWVVNDDDVVEMHQVEFGKIHAGMRAVRGGLNETDWVFIERSPYGVGTRVNTKRVEMPSGPGKAPRVAGRLSRASSAIAVGHRVDHPGGLAAVAVVSGEGAFELAVEGLDGGVEHLADGVEVLGAEGVGVSGEAGPGEEEGVGPDGEAGGDLVGLQGFEVGPVVGGSIIGAALGGGAGVGPGGFQGQELDELGPGGGGGITGEGAGADEGGEEPPGVGQRDGPGGVADDLGEVGAGEFDGRLVDQGLGGADVEHQRGSGQPAGRGDRLGDHHPALGVEIEGVGVEAVERADLGHHHRAHRVGRRPGPAAPPPLGRFGDRPRRSGRAGLSIPHVGTSPKARPRAEGPDDPASGDREARDPTNLAHRRADR